MRLGIDLDGVVADFDNGWLGRYHSEFGVRPASQVEWDGLHRTTHFPDMAAFWEWIQQRRVFRHLEPIPGALAGLTALAADGHEIVIISAKPEWAVPDTLHWIAEHRLPTREIHFRNDKHRVACDVYLDDSPVQLPRFVTHRPEALVCRMVAPWNAPVPGTVDVTDWSAFLGVVGGARAGAERSGEVVQG
jgi:5'(3')-deoxyribonucleotidase